VVGFRFVPPAVKGHAVYRNPPRRVIRTVVAAGCAVVLLAGWQTPPPHGRGSSDRDMLVTTYGHGSGAKPGGKCSGKRCGPRVGPRQGVRCPRGSVRLSPRRNLQAAINARPAGTSFCLREGVYRLRAPLLPKSRDVFVGEYGAILRGSKVIRKWKRVGRFWVAAGQTQENEVILGIPCQAGIECNRPEGVFINNRPLLQVTTLEAVERGRFFFDYANDKVYIANDPRRRRVEASVAAGAFRSTHHYAEGVVIKNVVIERFANPSRTGAIYDTASPGWVVANSEVALNHGIGIAHTNGTTIQRSDIHHNGQLGLGSHRSVGVVVEDNEIAWNAIGGFAGWEAGGAKYTMSTNLSVRGNFVHHNQHHGLWTNGDNVHTTYENNRVVANAGSGITHEEAFDCVIRGNRITRNGEHGIFISSSSGVDVHGNELEANRLAGVQLFIDGATGYDLANNVIHGNRFIVSDGTYNGLSTAGVADPSPYFSSRTNRFEGNIYEVPDFGGRYWLWEGGLRGWSEWRAAGQDTAGVLE
jgi:parallel beta-helix repeat protein